MNSLKEKYTKEIIPALTEKYNYTTVMAVPKLEKIVVNMGVGDATLNSKLLDVAVSELEKITGATPVITKAKKSIAAFKLREGVNVGCKVTLRARKMYDFAEKLFANGQIFTQYVDENGNPSIVEPDNPNGSMYAIEGMTSPDGRVLGKMGHSERQGAGRNKNIYGQMDQKLFESGVNYFKK